jgi:hypothetical protein
MSACPLLISGREHQWGFAPTVGYFRCTHCGERVDHKDPRFAKMLAEREAKLKLIDQMQEAREADIAALHTNTIILKRMRQMKAALQECEAYFEERADAEIDHAGTHGNREMQLLAEVRQALGQYPV